jgi:hypothetical protein
MLLFSNGGQCDSTAQELFGCLISSRLARLCAFIRRVVPVAEGFSQMFSPDLSSICNWTGAVEQLREL